MSPAKRFNPFPGLRSFEPDEDHLFFGREAQTDELLRRLRTARFLAVVGTSGSGKSSLVRSGLIPALYGGAMSGASSAWRVAILRPEADPIRNLANALAAPGALGGAPSPPDRMFLEANLRASRLGLVESVREARLPPDDRLLVLVDQFEELFRFRQSGQRARDEALAFVGLLVEAARDPTIPVYVALTLRSEYMGHCMEFPDLPEAINDGLYLVPRMTREQMRSAIVGPVKVGGGQIALRLVQQLLNDVGDNPDQLPILQHALMRTWDVWDSTAKQDEMMDLQHYKAVGTMRRALSLHADEAYDGLDSEGQQIAEKMFKALTEPGPDGRGVRRPVTIGEVCAVTGATEDEVVRVVECFRRPRRSFLTPPAGETLRASSVLDLSHESLIRIWDKLSAWVKEETRAARECRDIAIDADRYARLESAQNRPSPGKAPAQPAEPEGVAPGEPAPALREALLRGLDLQIALAWRKRVEPTPAWTRRYDPAYLWSMRFLDESEREQQRVIADQERQRRNRQYQAWALIAFFALGTFFWLGMWGHARANRLLAEKATREAVAAKENALRATGKALTAEQEALRQKTLADEERDKAVKSEQREREQRKRAEASEVRAVAEKQAAELAKQDAREQQRNAEAMAVYAGEQQNRAEKALSDAELQTKLANAYAKTALQQTSRAERLKNLAEARELATQSLRLQQDKELPLSALLAIQAYKLHRDSREGFERETAAYKDKTDFYRALQSALSRWSERPSSGNSPTVKQKPAEDRASMVWRPDVAVRTLLFDERGRLVAGTEDGRIRAFGGQKAVRPFQTGVRLLGLGPSPEVLVAGSQGGSLVVLEWPEYGGRARVLFEWGGEEDATGARVSVTALAFHPQGWLAAGGADGSVHLWKWQAGQAVERPLLRPPTPGDPVTSLVFSKEGGKLAASSRRGILVWNHFETSVESTALTQDTVRTIDLSRDGRLLAGGTGDGQVVLWDLSTKGSPRSKRSHASSAVNAVRFSSDVGSLASAGSDGTVKLWEVRLGEDGTTDLEEPPLTLFGHASWVWSADFKSDGQWVASGSEDRTVRLWPISFDFMVERLCQRLREAKLSKRDNTLYRPQISMLCPKPTKRVETSGATP